MSCCTGFGQNENLNPLVNVHTAQVDGPFDWDCTRHATQEQYDECIIAQDWQNLAIRLDTPEVWTHRIAPAAVIGVSLGILTGYLVWGRK